MPGVCGELTWLILLFSVPLQQEKLLTGKIASLEATKMDTLGIEPRASRMLSGCDTATPCAHSDAVPRQASDCHSLLAALWQPSL